MELQRHAMLMYTSCGWFFDELSGIETVQVMQYAGRAVQLAEELFGDQREGVFLEKLSQAKSNIPEHQDGATIYRKFVKPAFVDLRKLAGHYATRSLFEPYETNTRVYDYAVERQAGLNLRKEGGRERRLALGRARFTSGITEESAVLAFAAFDRGDLNPIGGILKVGGDRGLHRIGPDAEPSLFRRKLRRGRQDSTSELRGRNLFTDGSLPRRATPDSKSDDGSGMDAGRGGI